MEYYERRKQKKIPENSDKPSEAPAMQPLKDQEPEGVSGGGFRDTLNDIMDYLSAAKTPNMD